MAAQTTFTWVQDPPETILGGFTLTARGVNAERLEAGHAHYRAGTPRTKAHAVASAFIGGRFLCHQAGSVAAAKRRLAAEIDRLSIGLLDVDTVEFHDAR